MKWLAVLLAAVALLVAGYAVYAAKRTETAARPHVRLIAGLNR